MLPLMVADIKTPGTTLRVVFIENIDPASRSYFLVK